MLWCVVKSGKKAKAKNKNKSKSNPELQVLTRKILTTIVHGTFGWVIVLLGRSSCFWVDFLFIASSCTLSCSAPCLLGGSRRLFPLLNHTKHAFSRRASTVHRQFNWRHQNGSGFMYMSCSVPGTAYSGRLAYCFRYSSMVSLSSSSCSQGIPAFSAARSMHPQGKLPTEIPKVL